LHGNLTGSLILSAWLCILSPEFGCHQKQYKNVTIQSTVGAGHARDVYEPEYLMIAGMARSYEGNGPFTLSAG